MSTSIPSPAPTSAAGSELEGAALKLAILSAALLWLGLFAWGSRYQSPLVLIPVAGAALAPFALWTALHAQTERRLRTPVTRMAVALSLLPSFAPVLLVLCAGIPWLGALAAVLAIGVLFVPVGRAWVHAPLLLGTLSLGVWPFAWISGGDTFRASLVCTLGCQLLALLGVQLGSGVLARQGRASVGVAYGIAFSAATLVLPFAIAMVYVTVED